MKRSAVAVLLVLTAALLVAGCGGGSSSTPTFPEGEHNEEITGPPGGGAAKATSPNAPAGSKVVSCGEDAEQLRATVVSCATARTTMDDWEGSAACALSPGDSRGSCSLGSFRCQAVKVGQGVSVSCAGPDGDVSFVKPAG
jgi:hypothetical protein